MSSPTIYENLSHQFETQRPISYEEKQEEPVKVVGGVNVSSLLRQRKASSSSTKNEDEDEWAEDHTANNQQQFNNARRSPSPEHSSNNNQNEGIKGIARYSYQKSRSFIFSQCITESVLF